MHFKAILLSLCLFVITLSVSAKDYQASMFGIKSDGTTLNTRSIQKAIDYISANGGGELKFYVGRYLTGSLHLKSNVSIYLAEGAIIVGSTNPYDYDMEKNAYGLLLAYGQENISIHGQGVIDGRGREVASRFLDQASKGIIKDALKYDRVSTRPRLLQLFSCKNVRIEGVTLTNSTDWTLSCEQCEDLQINRVTVNSTAYWNNDGIDITDCNRTLITNCYVNATDDGICLKSSSSDAVCQHIEVRHCVIRSSASGIKFGTASCGGFQHIKIIGNTVYDTFRSAITIQSVDGGRTEDVFVDSLRAINTGNPIYLVIGERRGIKSTMSHIRISHVYVEVPASKPDAGYPYEGPVEDNPRNISPSSIIGLPGNPIRDVTVSDVTLIYPGGGNPHYARVGTDELDQVPEMPKAYPEFSQHKELPAWGFYVRHTEGLTFNNIHLIAAKKDYRPAIVLDDSKNAVVRNLKIDEPDAKGKTQIFRH